MPQTILEGYLQLVEQLRGLPGVTIRDYFQNTEPTDWQAEVLRQFGHLTIHDFICLAVEGFYGEGDEEDYHNFEHLAEINRKPLNHFYVLLSLYEAAMFDQVSA